VSILGTIISSIFHHGGAKPPPVDQKGSATPSASPAPPSPAPTTPQAAPTGAQSSPPAAQVDVEAVLTKLASQNKEKLDWRRSIVDLMKLLNLDSGLAARKELAHELHYTGDTNDSAAMNIWLHKQVMIKLAENGGKVPDSLKSDEPSGKG
jgi:hypothetical protein